MKAAEFFEQWPQVRIKGPELQTLTYRLQTVSGRQARIIGTFHHATTDYFRQVERYMENAPGTILQEGTPNLEDPVTIADPNTLKLLTSLREIQLSSIARMRGVGIDILYQRDHLQYPEGRTEPTDLTLEDWSRELHKRNFSFGEMETENNEFLRRQRLLIFMDTLALENERKQVRRALQEQMSEFFIFKNPPEKPIDAFREIVDSVREEHVLQRILSSNDNVVIPWGAAHIYTFHEQLVDNNEWLVDTKSPEYLTAYTCQD